jgi:hypothetical protein
LYFFHQIRNSNARFTKIIEKRARCSGKEKIEGAEAAMLFGEDFKGRFLNQYPVFMVILLNFVSLARKEGRRFGEKWGSTIPSSMSGSSFAAQIGIQMTVLRCTRS